MQENDINTPCIPLWPPLLSQTSQLPPVSFSSSSLSSFSSLYFSPLGADGWLGDNLRGCQREWRHYHRYPVTAAETACSSGSSSQFQVGFQAHFYTWRSVNVCLFFSSKQSFKTVRRMKKNPGTFIELKQNRNIKNNGNYVIRIFHSWNICHVGHVDQTHPPPVSFPQAVANQCQPMGRGERIQSPQLTRRDQDISICPVPLVWMHNWKALDQVTAHSTAPLRQVMITPLEINT